MAYGYVRQRGIHLDPTSVKRGPKGEQGDPGAKGDKGDKGDQGPSGEVQRVTGTVTLPAVPGLYEVYAVTTANVNGIGLDAGDAAVFRLLGSQWSYMVVGRDVTWQPGPAVPDTTPPTPGTLTATPAQTSLTAVVSGASDDVALHAQPYAFSVDAGATWTPWQASATHVQGDLNPGTDYTVSHKVRDTAGNVALGEATTTATLPPDIADDFTAADLTLVAGRVTPVGGLTWAKDSETSPVSGLVATTDLTINSNSARKPRGGFGGATQLNPGSHSTMEVSADYELGSGRIHLGIMGVSEGARLTMFYDYAQGIKVYRYPASGTGRASQIGATVTGQATSGRIAFGYDGAKVYVKINGAKVLDVVTATTGGSRLGIGIGTGTGQWLDNVAVIYP